MNMITGKRQFYCKKCKKTMNEDLFYGSNNLEKYPEVKIDQCKQCMTMHVDNWDPDTYLWILQECDVPYVPEEWNKLLATYGKDKSKVTGATIVGRYLSKMKLKQWKDYRWKDTEFLQELADTRLEQAMKRQGFGAAEIEMAKQQGHVPIPEGELIEPPPPPQAENPYITTEDYFTEQSGVEINIDLTDEDKTYLCLKWGKAYKPSEWVALEQLYNEMLESYDIQAAGDINTLKLACKTSLKANQLLDMGDIEGAQKVTKMYDSLMKSGKWTAAQNKAESNDDFSSIGELVALCERQGFIPRYYVDKPQDKLDRVIEDMQKYTHDLIANETNLNIIVESAAKQLIEEEARIAEAARQDEESEEDKLFDYNETIITEEDYDEFNDLIESEHLIDISEVD